jgi:hypothetical protein
MFGRKIRVKGNRCGDGNSKRDIRERENSKVNCLEDNNAKEAEETGHPGAGREASGGVGLSDVPNTGDDYGEDTKNANGVSESSRPCKVGSVRERDFKRVNNGSNFFRK